MNGEIDEVGAFDFDAHSEAAVARFRSVRLDYELLAEVSKRLLHETLSVSGIRVHSIEARAKSFESFANSTLHSS